MDIPTSLPASSSSVAPAPSGGLFSGMVNAFRGARNTHDRIFSHGVLSKVFLRLNDKEKMMKMEVRLIFGGHVKKNDSGFRTLMYIAEKGVDLRKILPKKEEIIRQSLVDLSNDLGRYFFNLIMTPVKSLEFSLIHIAKPLKENGFIDTKMYDVLAEMIKLKKLRLTKTHKTRLFMTI